MEPDLQQILNFAGPLLGTIVGGLITYLATRAADHRKWKRERQEKLDERRREALEVAYSWVTPLDCAIAKAEGYANLYRHGTVDKERLLEQWPHALGAVEDVPDHLRPFLPEDAYRLSLGIVNKLEELKVVMLNHERTFDLTDEGKEMVRQRLRLLQEVKDNLQSLRDQLEEAYLKTFA